jgi:hypothetical protein
MSKNVAVLQYLDDQLFIKARIIDFNFEKVKNP